MSAENRAWFFLALSSRHKCLISCKNYATHPGSIIGQDSLIEQIFSEAKRILAEHRGEVMGETLRARLLDYGLRQDQASSRVLFPA